ncbi:MAG TPA: DUF4127 family protein [Chloroflexota bacterium]|nr:DUF4127 family protein [Chloroflexota bacterium]
MRILLIPLDDRPVTRVLPAMAAAVAGIDVLTPPLALLGTLNRPGDPAALSGWIEDQTEGLDGTVISIDMLAHGGLVNSRRSLDPLDSVLSHLDVIRRVRANHPGMPIYGFNILQRISNADNNQEEKLYWDRYGRAMFRLSQLTDAVDRYHRSEDERELGDVRARIPADLLDDYLATRRRNHALNLAMIDWAAAGVFDYLAITQDDANPLGFPAMEQRALSLRIAELGAYDRVAVYPGADEVATSLIARLACSLAGLRPRVWPRYSSVRGPFITANYEDRPLGETVKGQILAAGGLVADGAGDADLVLMANTPAEAQAEAFEGIDYASVQTTGRNLDEFVSAIRDYQDRDVPVAVVDVAYSNGADPTLLPPLLQTTRALDFLAFAGWNTAGNTIGSALGQAYLRLLAQRRGVSPREQAAHIALLLTRYLDDWAYQSVVRSRAGIRELEQTFGVSYGDLGSEATAVSAAVRDRLLAIYQDRLEPLTRRSGINEVEIGPVRFPWNRLFEIDLPVRVAAPNA